MGDTYVAYHFMYCTFIKIVCIVVFVDNNCHIFLAGSGVQESRGRFDRGILKGEKVSGVHTRKQVELHSCIEYR